jgi:hypothetical protein
MCSLLPIKTILKSITTALGNIINELSTFSTIWEDIFAAKILATTAPPPMKTTFQTFSHPISLISWLVPGCIPILIQSIASAQQKANILAKALTKQKQEEARKVSMGW